MDREKIGFGIIGTGSVSIQHAKAIRSLDNCRLVAVCSSSESRAREAEKKFGVPAYHDYRELLAHADVQVVCICTESGRHLAPALAAAQAGKHVLCEKPLEVTLERADQMIRACRKAGVKLGCIFQNRFSESYIKLKNAVREGLLGNLILGNAYIKWYRDDEYYTSSHWRGTFRGDGGAALINQGIHTIDLLLDVMGEVESVNAKIKTVAHDIEGEDLGVAMLTFQNGALGAIEGSTAAYPGYPERLEIFGDRGSIILEAGKIVAWNVMGSEAQIEPETLSGRSGAGDPTAIGFELHRRQIEDMAEAVRSDREPLVNGEEGRKALALIRSIYRSAKEGREVVV
jgi:UDP-N-acetyl-2-amino-2-deoxyglucuronate dehydrogenase